MAKRIFDFIVSLFGLIVFSPLIVILIILIKQDGGPIFYRGERIGRLGKPFKIYKFRSMVINADKLGPASTSDQDSRVTKVGRFIRKFKMDEVSQLINVFFGDMSLVGPRPEVKKFVELYTQEEKELLTLRPGITDWSSIKFHNEGEIIEKSGIKDADEAYAKLIRPTKLKLQLKYLKERTFWTDVKIIFFTIVTIISTRMGKGIIGVPEIE